MKYHVCGYASFTQGQKQYIVFTQILYLLSVKREKEGIEKCKDDAYDIDHGFRPKSL